MEMCNNSGRNTSVGCEAVAGATIISPVLMFMAGVLGNILALVALYRTRTDRRTTRFYTLVTAMAWTDLLGILMTSPSTIAAYINNRQWAGGAVHCRYHGFVMTCFGMATPLIICAMAVERVIALRFAFFYSTYCRNWTTIGTIATLWFCVIWFGLLPMFGFGQFEMQHPGTWCFFDFHSDSVKDNTYGYIYASTNLLLILIIISCNCYVITMLIKARYIRESDRSNRERLISGRTDTSENDRLMTERHRDLEVQMIVFMAAITAVFVVCWSPLMIQIIVTMATRNKNGRLWDLIDVRLASLNQTFDPWLYILLRRSFCERIKKTVTQIVHFCFPGNKRLHDHNGTINAMENRQTLKKLVNDVRLHIYCEKDGDMPCALHEPIKSDVSLPDVTSGCEDVPVPAQDGNDMGKQNASQYVCQFHIGAKQTFPNDGIYVKFLFIPKPSDEGVASASRYAEITNRSILCRHHSYGNNTSGYGDETTTHNTVEGETGVSHSTHATRSDACTKTTSLGTSVVKPDCHSEQGNSPAELYVAKHEILRRTKSHI